MPIRTNTLSPSLSRQRPAATSGAGPDPAQPNGSSPALNQQLGRARQALARGDLSPTDAAKLRNFLLMANRALSRGDTVNAQRYADEAEKTSGAAPTAPSSHSENGEDRNKPGGTDAPGESNAPTADAGQKLGRGERRAYQDASGDPGVSFKEPTPMTSGQAEVLVRFHEGQHFRRDTEKAAAEGRKVVYAYTAIEYRTDPATGERYIKGGKTVVKTVAGQTPKIDAKA